MTSTTFSSKEFKTLYKWSFKRNQAIMIIFSVMVGIGIVLNLFVIAQSGTEDEAAPATIAIFEYLGALFTFISAIKTFSFLHNKRTVDMFGALPTNRQTMFLTHLLGGLTAISIPYTAGSLLVMGLQAHSADAFKASIFTYLTGLLMLVSAYIFTVLIAYCCGTIVDTILITIGLNGIWMGLVLFIYGLMSELIPGFEFENIADSPLLSAFTPYGFGGVDLFFFYDSSKTAVAANITWQVLFTIGVFFLTLYVSRYRKAETSQNGFAFKWLPELTKAGASIVVGFGAGMIGAEVSDGGYGNMYVFIFWYIILAVSAYFVLHLIFARGLHGKFSFHAIVISCTSVGAIIFVIALTFGLGIDTYVPADGNIKYVEFDSCTFKEPENIKRVTQIHHLITDKIREEEDYPYYLGSSSNSYNYIDDEPMLDDYSFDSYGNSYYKTPQKSYEYVNNCNFDFTYHKKAGFTTKRNYYIYTSDTSTHVYDLAKMDKLIQELRNSEEYKVSQYPEIFNEKVQNNIKNIEYANLSYILKDGSYSTTTMGTLTLPNNIEFFKDFADAYSKDLLADTNAKKSNRDSRPEGDEYIEITFNINYKKYGYIDGKYYYDSNKEYIVEYTYKNTLEFLEKNGYTKENAVKSSEPTPKTDSGYVYSAYMQSYIDFGMAGDYSDFEDFVNDMALQWEYDACMSQGVEDYSDWHRKYYTEYKNLLLKQAKSLYDYYNTGFYEVDPGYTNDYIRETGVYGDFFQLEDQLIKELNDFSEHYVSGTLRNFDSDSNKDSDKETDSSDRDSDNNSKKDEAKDSDSSAPKESL